MMGGFFTRPRIGGLALLGVAFALGVLIGRAWDRSVPEGITMTLVASDTIPRELEALDLSTDQRARIQGILRESRPRVLQVLDDMQPRMRGVLDATEADIRKVLTPEQAARWSAHRAQNPPRFERRIHGR